MTSAEAGAYFIFYAEKELGTFGTFEFRVCRVPSPLTTSCLALSQAGCARRGNCVFAGAGSREPGARGQLPGALRGLCGLLITHSSLPANDSTAGIHRWAFLGIESLSPPSGPPHCPALLEFPCKHGCATKGSHRRPKTGHYLKAWNQGFECFLCGSITSSCLAEVSKWMMLQIPAMTNLCALTCIILTTSHMINDHYSWFADEEIEAESNLPDINWPKALQHEIQI